MWHLWCICNAIAGKADAEFGIRNSEFGIAGKADEGERLRPQSKRRYMKRASADELIGTEA